MVLNRIEPAVRCSTKRKNKERLIAVREGTIICMYTLTKYPILHLCTSPLYGIKSFSLILKFSFESFCSFRYLTM